MNPPTKPPAKPDVTEIARLLIAHCFHWADEKMSANELSKDLARLQPEERQALSAAIYPEGVISTGSGGAYLALRTKGGVTHD